jgi:hypothetical protein
LDRARPCDVLILVIDAIPWSLARAAWSAGLLPGFGEPRPVVSTFPSLTNVAVPALIDAAVRVSPPGYEARWVEPERRRVRGMLGRVADEPGLAPFRGRPEGALDTYLEYAMRQRTATVQLAWIRDHLLAEAAPWLGYLRATDAIGHFDGHDALLEVFATVAAEVAALGVLYERRHGRPLEVVLCSDHGMAFDVQHWLSDRTVVDAVASLGLTRGVGGTDGFQVAPLGDVAGGAVWCDARRAPDVASALVKLPGVELAVARLGDGALVVRDLGGRLSTARVRWTGTRYAYEHDGTDPLVLEPRVAPLRGPGGWVDDDALLHATFDGPYPDALRRIRRGLTDLVAQPAEVLFSMADGWTWGRPLVHGAARLVGGQIGTHGGLGRVQSWGFVAARGETAAVRALQAAPVVRAEDVVAGLRRETLLGSARGWRARTAPKVRRGSRGARARTPWRPPR